MLSPEYSGIGEIFARFENGDVAGWALIHEEDASPAQSDGLRLIVRTEGRSKNAYADAFVSADQIRDDESGAVLDMLLQRLRRDCERELAAAI